MKTESIDFPPKLAELIGKSLISSLSRTHNVAQKRWEFDMFLDIDEPFVLAIDGWLFRVSYSSEYPRMLVNFNYEPFKYDKTMHDLARTYNDYYQLNKMFAELNPNVNWSKLKSLKMTHHFNFESWITYFEISYPENYKFLISSIIKNFSNDQTKSV